MKLLEEKNISLNQTFKTPQEAIIYAGEKMKSLGLIKEEYIESMLVRQDKLSVYIGNFVALPHGEVQDEFILEEGIFVTQVPDGIDFSNTEQKQIATIIISVALRKESQLRGLQELAFFCSDIENVRKLSDEVDEKQFVTFFNESISF